MTYRTYFDGACQPVNPGGTASYGAVIFDDDRRIWECSEIYSPPEGREHETTSNVAEYLGLLAVLNYFLERRMTGETIVIHGDSNLVIQQCFGTWKIKKKGRLYEGMALEAREKLREFADITGRWIPREENSIADQLSKAELKKKGIAQHVQPE